MMGNSKNLHVFSFEILLKLQKFDALKIYVFSKQFARNYLSYKQKTRWICTEPPDINDI